jgi:hypothetical protein
MWGMGAVYEIQTMMIMIGQPAAATNYTWHTQQRREAKKGRGRAASFQISIWGFLHLFFPATPSRRRRSRHGLDPFRPPPPASCAPSTALNSHRTRSAHRPPE